MADDGTHECPAPGCEERCPFDRLACRQHWYSIPKKLRDALWRAWQVGTVAEHAEARDACVKFLEDEAAAPA